MWKLTVDPLCGNCQSPPMINSVNCLCWLPLHQSSICPPRFNSVNCLCIDHLFINHWCAPQDQVLITSASITSMSIVYLHPGSSVDCLCINHLYVNHWPAPTPGSTVLIASASITSMLIIDLPTPRINSVDRLCVTCRSTPLTDFNFLIFNVKILLSKV